MIKEQENLVDGILNYLKMDSSGALMITGPWGCGKAISLNTLCLRN